METQSGPEAIVETTSRESEMIKKNKEIITATTFFAYETDKKIEALVDALDRAGVIKREDFEEEADKRRGLKLKTEGEVIERNDVAWVSYQAFIDGDKPIGENEIPVRVTEPNGKGVGAVWAMDMVGKKPFTKFSVEKTFTSKDFPAYLGKVVRFDVEIGKVKSPIDAGPEAPNGA